MNLWGLESGGAGAGEFIEWLTIHDQEQSVRDDVQRIREYPLVPKKIAIYGYVYDVKSGRLLEVPEAKRHSGSRCSLIAERRKLSGYPQSMLPAD
jgi:hypothetical protein